MWSVSIKQLNMKKLYSILVLIVFIFIGGLFLGYKLSPQKEISITAESILQSLQSEGFLVTQTYIFHERVEIDKSTGSSFKDLFWKQNITAAANMKVSAGTNMEELTEKNVNVKRNSIEVSIPEIETYSVEILGDVTLHNSQGILKKIFDNEDGYNESIAQLKEQALNAVENDEFKDEARSSAQKEIAKIIRLLGESEKEVSIKFE